MASAKKESKAVKAARGPKAITKQPMLAKEAAKLLGCSMALMYQMKRDGRLKSGHLIGKHLHFDTSEIQKLHASGEVHPRSGQQKLGVGDIIASHQSEARFEIACPAAQYNMLAMMLAPQNLSVSQWCAQMISNSVAEAQRSMIKVVAAGGSRK
jgi:hypothetical protein